MDTVLLEKQGRIAYVTYNRPQRLNACNLEMIRDLVAVKRQIEDDDDIWVAIYTGSGRAFSAGADLQRDPDDPDAGHNPASLQELLERSLVRHYKPSIAAINGLCYGRGLAWAMDCDIRIASEQAVLCCAESRWNFAERWTPILASSIPPATAMWMLATTMEVPAARAREIGLVMDVVPHDQLMDEATALAERICTNGPLAVRAGVQIMRTMIERRKAEVDDLSAFLGLKVRDSEDSRSGEAQKAFAEKRKPNWQAR